MKFDMYEYIMTPNPISTAYLLNPSHQCVYHPIVARQRPAKNFTAAADAEENRIIVGRVVFYAVFVVSKESR
jgi:hypothetical protein